MKTVVLDLLRKYLNVEHHFQQGKKEMLPTTGDRHKLWAGQGGRANFALLGLLSPS